MEDSKKLNRDLGAEDRQRLDQYFTGLRDLERRAPSEGRQVSREAPGQVYDR